MLGCTYTPHKGVVLVVARAQEVNDFLIPRAVVSSLLSVFLSACFFLSFSLLFFFIHGFPSLSSFSPLQMCRIYVGSLDYYLTELEIKSVFQVHQQEKTLFFFQPFLLSFLSLSLLCCFSILRLNLLLTLGWQEIL